MRPADSRRALLAALLALLAVPGGAEERKLTLERLHADPPLAGSLPAGLCWHPDGKRLCYLRHRAPGAPADLVAMDAGSGRETPLLSGEAVKNPTTGKALSLDAYAWSRDGERLLVAAEGDVFVVEIKTGSAHALTRTPEAEEFPQLSPDGRRVAFVRKSDLYVVDVQSGRETRLTKSGSDTVLNGRLDWVYEEELASRSGKASLSGEVRLCAKANLSARANRSVRASRRVTGMGPGRGRGRSIVACRRRSPQSTRPSFAKRARGRRWTSRTSRKPSRAPRPGRSRKYSTLRRAALPCSAEANKHGTGGQRR
jgi:dipeptidyl aminopeptidase/acylaminoacyl peptidase